MCFVGALLTNGNGYFWVVDLLLFERREIVSWCNWVLEHMRSSSASVLTQTCLDHCNCHFWRRPTPYTRFWANPSSLFPFWKHRPLPVPADHLPHLNLILVQHVFICACRRCLSYDAYLLRIGVAFNSGQFLPLVYSMVTPITQWTQFRHSVNPEPLSLPPPPHSSFSKWSFPPPSTTTTNHSAVVPWNVLLP